MDPDDQTREAARLDSFYSIPEHFWEKVMDYLKPKPRDMWNLNLALPHLSMESYFQKRKPDWFGGMVASVLAGWNRVGAITEADLLAYRATCRSGWRSIDEWLEKQPALNAYKPEDKFQVLPVPELARYTSPTCSVPVRFDTLWNTKGYMNKITGTWTKCRPDYHGGVLLRVDSVFEGRVDESKRTIPWFIVKFLDHYPSTNPFLSRLVAIQVSNPDNFQSFMNVPIVNLIHVPVHSMENKERQISFIPHHFGRQVYFLRLDFLMQDFSARVFVSIITGMRNLKSIELRLLRGQGQIHAWLPTILSELQGTLPHINTLETLKITTLHYSMARVLLEKYGTQLRWIQFELFHLEHRKRMMRKMFPSLTELDLTLTRRTSASFSKGFTVEKYLLFFLTNLRSKNLTKISLTGPEIEDAEGIVLGIDDLLKSCSGHEELIMMDIGTNAGGIFFFDKHEVTLQSDPVKWEFLSIRDNQYLTYNFLLATPKLKKLQIYVGRYKYLVQENPLSPVKLRDAIENRNLYQSNVWEILPKLEEIEVVEEALDWLKPIHFNRRAYDKFWKP